MRTDSYYKSARATRCQALGSLETLGTEHRPAPSNFTVLKWEDGATSQCPRGCWVRRGEQDAQVRKLLGGREVQSEPPPPSQGEKEHGGEEEGECSSQGTACALVCR